MTVTPPAMAEIRTVKVALMCIWISDSYRLSDFVSWVIAFFQFGSISAMEQAYPLLGVFVVRRVVWYIVMIQWGFLWYYLEHRQLVTADTVRIMCSRFHVVSWTLTMFSYFWVQPWKHLPLALGWAQFPYGAYAYYFLFFYLARWKQRKLAAEAAASKAK